MTQQEIREGIERKAKQGDGNAQLKAAIMNEHVISNDKIAKIHQLLKAKAYYKAACANQLKKGCDGYNRLKKHLVQYDLFSEYKVNHVYDGPFRKPDFKGRDRAYRHYRTYISEAAEEGPNFAGKYAIATMGCGTGCFLAYIVNTQTGQVISELPIDGNTNNSADLAYHLNSRIILTSYPIMADSIVTVYNKLLFNGKRFELLQSSYAIEDACHFDDLEVAWYICAENW